jgi:hypothetical protein
MSKPPVPGTPIPGMPDEKSSGKPIEIPPGAPPGADLPVRSLGPEGLSEGEVLCGKSV